MRIKQCQHNGFTLIELLVAFSIFAVVSVLAITGLQSILSSQEQQKNHQNELRQYQLAYTIIKRDLAQIVMRPVLTLENEILPNFMGYETKELNLQSDEEERLFEFTRAGVVNPLGKENRSSLERVMYILQNNQLIRLSTYDIDHVDYNSARQVVLIKNLESIEVNYIDENSEFFQKWEVKSNQNSKLPSMMDIKLTKGDKQYQWRYLLPGGRRDK